MTQPAPPCRPVKCNILLTCAGLLLIAALGLLPFFAGPPPEKGLPDIVKFIGRFHPVILHLPIGILAWVLVHEMLNLIPGKRIRSSSRAAAGFAAVSAVAAALLGFLLYYSLPDYDKELAERHLFGGILFSCMAVATFIVKVWVDSAGGKGTLVYRILLLASAGVMGAASHDGASLTHGKGYLTDHAPDQMRKWLGLPERKPPGPGHSASDADNLLVYTDVIVPILEQKCYTCHNAEKKKGKFRMDEYELLLKGGKQGDGVIPGDPAKSNMIVRIELPEGDDGHMPPEGKTDLHAHELALLKWWISKGAPKDAKLADLAASDEVKQALSKLAPGSPVKESAKPKVTLSASFKADIDGLRREFPAALNYEFQGADTLVFTALGMRDKFGDKQLAKLQPVLPAMVSLDMSHSSVTDEGVKTLASATRLKSLRLAETKVGDAALETLSKLTGLESLNLYGTQVTSQGILKLSNLKGLRKLYLWQTRVDEKTLQALREKLPYCEIVTGT
jgi:uncharacterized membrane protein